jgi:hypothetical protein
MLFKQLLEAFKTNPKISMQDLCDTYKINTILLKRTMQQLSFEGFLVNSKEYCSENGCKGCSQVHDCGLAELRYTGSAWLVTHSGTKWLENND